MKAEFFSVFMVGALAGALGYRMLRGGKRTEPIAPPADEIRYAGALLKLRAEPGDVFVIHTDRLLPEVAKERLLVRWKEHMGDAKVLFFDGGMKLGVVQKAQR